MLFGSYARKKQKEDSDVDIVVRTEDVIGGVKIVEVKCALEEALNKKVVTKKYENWQIFSKSLEKSF